jgi:hypothetical protein
MEARVIKDRHRSELAAEDLPEKLPGVVEPMARLWPPTAPALP